MTDLTFEDRKFLKELRESFTIKAVEHFEQVFGVKSVKVSGYRIVVRGSVCLDIYDEHPGFAYFHNDTFKSIEISPYTRVSKLREIGLQHFRFLKEVGESDEPFDGQFIPKSIEIENGKGEVIDCYEQGGWLDDVIEANQLANVENEIARLQRRARYEGGWDNHETSRQLFREAHSLAVRVSISRHRVRG